MVEKIYIAMTPRYFMGEGVVSQCEWKAKVNGEWYGELIEFTDNLDTMAKPIMNRVIDQMWRTLEELEEVEKMTRDEALEILDHNWTRLVNPDYTDEELGKAQDVAIEALEVKRGEWIFNPSDAIEAMFTKPKCSECGFESADGGNYCSNCGARMGERGEDDS